jgi:hypothetical protein
MSAFSAQTKLNPICSFLIGSIGRSPTTAHTAKEPTSPTPPAKHPVALGASHSTLLIYSHRTGRASAPPSGERPATVPIHSSYSHNNSSRPIIIHDRPSYSVVENTEFKMSGRKAVPTPQPFVPIRYQTSRKLVQMFFC